MQSASGMVDLLLRETTQTSAAHTRRRVARDFPSSTDITMASSHSDATRSSVPVHDCCGNRPLAAVRLVTEARGGCVGDPPFFPVRRSERSRLPLAAKVLDSCRVGVHAGKHGPEKKTEIVGGAGGLFETGSHPHEKAPSSSRFQHAPGWMVGHATTRCETSKRLLRGALKFDTHLCQLWMRFAGSRMREVVRSSREGFETSRSDLVTNQALDLERTEKVPTSRQKTPDEQRLPNSKRRHAAIERPTYSGRPKHFPLAPPNSAPRSRTHTHTFSSPFRSVNSRHFWITPPIPGEQT